MIDARIEFKTDPADTIPALKLSLQKRGINRAIKQALPPVVEAVKQGAEQIADTGTLAASIGQKTKIYKNAVVGIVGPKSKFQRTFGTFSRGKHKGEPKIKKPSKYAHLVEKGTSHSKANPFLKDALSETSSQYLETVSDLIKQEIEIELNKSK